MSLTKTVRYIPVVMLVLLSTCICAAFQSPQEGDQQPPDAAPSESAAAEQTGEVKLEVEKFGVGKACRPGEWTGIRIRALDTSSKPREVIVRLLLRDPDGDVAVAQRDITTNPNTWQGVWLYHRLPFSFRSSEVLTVECFEAVEVKDSKGVARFDAGRRLGEVRISPQGLVESYEGMIAVVGTKTVGLNNYGVTLTNGSTPALGHESAKLVVLTAPNELPDRWMGLMQFDAIVWTAGDPADLRGERATALREWIKRGGHLIIVLPTVGQTWTSSANNELYDLLPAVTISRHEAFDLSTLRSMLTHSTRIRMPRNTVLHTFRPVKDAAPDEAMMVLKTPGTSDAAECVVARRLVGAGAVTLIGFDLNNRELLDLAAVDADVLWNRVLGRRGIFPTPSELTELAKTTTTASGPVPERTSVSVDNDIQGLINHTATAGAGVLLGLVTFGIYWLIAGPLGFYLLKQRGRTNLAWIAFIGVGAVFTAISWVGAAMLRPGNTEASHLTILDHVYGQPTQRARAWMQVLIPFYGDATIRVGEPGEKDPQHSITAWEPRRDSESLSSFTDTREYYVDWRAPSAITVPVRATIKQVQVDWAGGPHLKMPIPVRPEGSTSDAPPALRIETVTHQNSERKVVVGALKHELPRALTDVWIIVVQRQKKMTGQSTDALPVDANIYSLTGPWEPGSVLDMEKITLDNSQGSLGTQVISTLMPSPKSSNQVMSTLSGDDKPNLSLAPRRLLAMSLYQMLEPPPKDQMSANILAFRRFNTHGYDISRWFTQPCVIIIGHLGEGIGKQGEPSPIPMSLDGEPLSTRGMTLVRWVYPLADNPPDVDPARKLDDVTPPPSSKTDEKGNN